MRVDFDTKPFVAGVATAVEDLEREGEQAVDRAGTSAGERAAALAPVKTGELRDSMEVIEGRDDRGFFVEVRFGSSHATENEFGTTRMRARPFLRPALAEAAAQFGRA